MSATCLFEMRLRPTQNRFAKRVQPGFQVPNNFYLGEDDQDTANSASGATKTSMVVASLDCFVYLACSWGNSSRWSTRPLGEPAQMGQRSWVQRHVVDTS